MHHSAETEAPSSRGHRIPTRFRLLTVELVCGEGDTRKWSACLLQYSPARRNNLWALPPMFDLSLSHMQSKQSLHPIVPAVKLKRIDYLFKTRAPSIVVYSTESWWQSTKFQNQKTDFFATLVILAQSSSWSLLCFFFFKHWCDGSCFLRTSCDVKTRH